MRFLLLVAAALALAAPSRAQITVVPLVGYDIDYKAVQLGAGVELGVTPSVLPFRALIRPSAEYVFGSDGGDGSTVRLNGDLLGRFALPGVPFQPYGKVGLGVELKSPDVGDSSTGLGLNLGVGGAFDRVLAEVTLGIGDISSARIGVGYRF